MTKHQVRPQKNTGKMKTLTPVALRDGDSMGLDMYHRDNVVGDLTVTLIGNVTQLRIFAANIQLKGRKATRMYVEIGRSARADLQTDYVDENGIVTPAKDRQKTRDKWLKGHLGIIKTRHGQI